MSYPLDLDEIPEERMVAELVRRRRARRAGKCDYCGRTLGSGAECKMTQRHAGSVGMGQAFLVDLIEADVQRAARWHPGFPDDDTWSLADWSNALAGEVGEACNVVKKIRRHEEGLRGVLDPDREGLLEALGEELADVLWYLLLLAEKAGIDLQAAAAAKFDAVSERQGFPDRIEL